jgi:outer membrane lipoprotein LolB
MRAAARSLALAGIVALLAGCAQLPFMSGRQHVNEDVFEAMGRVYVRFGQRGFSGSLRWRHDGETDEVWLGGPLGQTAAHIVRDPSGATLTTADQRTYRAWSIESLTEEGLGWRLPLADLSYYVVAKVPPAAEASAVRDPQGRLVNAQHDGWTVRWLSADSNPDAAPEALPRLNLTRNDVEIRVVIDRLDRGR